MTFKSEQPDFVKSYESNRLIIDPARITTQLKGIVTSQADGKPIRNAAVTIVELSITAKTNTLGEYVIKPATAGSYTIRVIAEGFTPVETHEVQVKMGAVNGLDVGLG